MEFPDAPPTGTEARLIYDLDREAIEEKRKDRKRRTPWA
jgi:hypothetical protein